MNWKSCGEEPGADAGEALVSLASRLDFWETLLTAQTSDQAFMSAWAAVARKIASLGSSPADAFLESEKGWRFHGRLAEYQRRYLALSEWVEAEHLLRTAPSDDSQLPHLLGSAFGKQTFGRLEEAVRLLDPDACERIVVAGCGAFPAAALFFHERSNAKITALEIDASAAGLARRVAERHASNRVSIQCQDAREHDYGAADAVYVVNQVTPKAGVLGRITSTGSPTARVIVRDPFGPGRLLADSIDGSLPRGWRIVTSGAVDPNFFSRHLLLAPSQQGPDGVAVAPYRG